MLQNEIYEFGPYRLSPGEHLLRCRGQAVPLTPKALDTLLLLVENHGRLVGKDELMKALWPDTFVEESSLTRNISVLRKLLNEGSGEEYIETHAKRGYRFVAEVRLVSDEALTIERHTRAVVVTEEEIEEGEPEPRIIPRVADTPALPAGTPRRTRMFTASAVLLVTLAALAGAAAFDWGGLASRWLGVRRGGWLGFASARNIQSMAVLPLVNLTGDPAQEYVADGITDALIADLGSIHAVRVISRTSSMHYKGGSQPLREIARELDVDAVVEGSVSRSGDRVKISVNLIDARSDRHLWSESFDSDLPGLMIRQAGMASAIAHQARVPLTLAEENRLRDSRPVQSQAYEAYLRGRYVWNKRSAETYPQALKYFQEAIDADPGFARAYAGMADTYALLALKGGRDEQEMRPKALAAVQKALELDDTLAEAHTSKAFLLMVKACRSEEMLREAEKEYLRAFELNPNYATAYHWYALINLRPGRYTEAVQSMKRARQLDPLSPIIQDDLGYVLYNARRYDEAIPEYLKALQMEPGFEPALIGLSMVYLEKQDFPNAISYAEQGYARAHSPSDRTHVYCANARAGKKAEAKQLRDEIEEDYRAGRASDGDMLGIYLCSGDKEHALRLMETMVEEDPNAGCGWNVFPIFDSLHDDPRFSELLRRAGVAH